MTTTVPTDALHDAAQVPVPDAVPGTLLDVVPGARPGAPLDTACVDAVAAWQPPSWEEIVREYSTRVYRLAYRLTGNRQDAEDLTQETFLRVFRSLHTYTPGTFEGWLHRITTNLFLDSSRRKARVRHEPMGDDADRFESRTPEEAPERAYEHQNLDDDVQRALDELPPEYRAAVVLSDIEQLSYEEIAVTLGIKLGTVRSRIHRARARLRVALWHRRPVGVEADVPAAG